MIQGFEQGTHGMLVGASALTIPPSLETAQAETQTGIAGNEWIVFDVQLVRRRLIACLGPPATSARKDDRTSTATGSCGVV